MPPLLWFLPQLGLGLKLLHPLQNFVCLRQSRVAEGLLAGEKGIHTSLVSILSGSPTRAVSVPGQKTLSDFAFGDAHFRRFSEYASTWPETIDFGKAGAAVENG